MLFPDKKYFLLFAAIIAAVGLYCFNPFVLYFQNDDFIHIPLSAEGKLFQHNSFRPVCDLSIMLDYFLWHKNACGYHLTNLLLHIFDTFLVFIFCKILFKKYALLNNVFEASFLTALLFFIYPNHSEAVFWILGRSASLGVLFFLLSLIFYLKREQKKYFLLSVLFAVIAWLTYESTWILIAVFFMISLVDLKLKFASSKKERLIFLFPVSCFIIYLVSRFYFIHEVVGEYEAGNFLNLNGFILAANYLKLMMRSWFPPFENSLLLITFSVLLSGILLLLFFKTKIKKQKIFFMFLIFLWMISLLPFASLGIDTKGTESERFLYLPSIFICVLTVFLFTKISNNISGKIFILLLFSAQLFFLFFNARSYRFAGNVVKTTLDEINKFSGKKNLYVNNLPQQNHGALIFRVGFFEAVKWIKNDGTVDSVFIVSQQKHEQRFCENYKVTYNAELPQMLLNTMLGENFNNSNEYKTTDFPARQLNKNDAYFNFTDSSLNVNF